jgi:cell division septation protein DedD
VRLRTGTTFWVQVGAFKNRTAAHRLATRLRRRPVEGAVVAVSARGHEQGLARVRVGPFPDRARAFSFLRDLKARGHPAFITIRR